MTLTSSLRLPTTQAQATPAAPPPPSQPPASAPGGLHSALSITSNSSLHGALPNYSPTGTAPSPFSLTIPISDADTHQQQIGDCTVISGIDTVADNDPDAIRNAITPEAATPNHLGDNYDVKLFVDGQWQHYSVNTADLPGGHATASNGNNYGPILEAAIIQANGGIDAIHKNDVDPQEVIKELTGQDTAEGTAASMYSGAVDAVRQHGAAELGVAQAQQDGWYNSQTGAFDGGHHNDGDVYIHADHEYAIDSVSGSTVTLNNPWNQGGDGGDHITVSEAALAQIFQWGASYSNPE